MTFIQRIPELPGAGRLGRHAFYDPHRAAYPYLAPAVVPVVSVRHTRHISILDQGDLGSCTGNMMTGAAATSPVFDGLAPGHATLNETLAVAIYSDAEKIDGGAGYPPEDEGSTGQSVCKAAKARGLISGYLWAASIDAVLAALMDGPVGFGINWYDCLAPDARVLTADLRWTPIQKLSPGDQIIGFDETADGKLGRSYRRARVLANDVVVKPAIVLSYDLDGHERTLTTSEGHLFLVRRNQMQMWCRADALRLGDQIYSLVSPYETDQSRDAGWLAGFFDGEGSVGIGTHRERGKERRSYRLDVAQNIGPTLESLKRRLSAAGFDFRVQNVTGPTGQHPNWKPKEVLWLPGGRRELLRFLGTVRPERLIANVSGVWEDQLVRDKTSVPATVTGVRKAARTELHAIGTSTGTLLVEGLLSHNSFDTPGPDGVVSLPPTATVRGGHEIVAGEVDADRELIWIDNSWGSSWGLAGRAAFPYTVIARLLSEDGDCVVPQPASIPVPVPVPPGPGVHVDTADRALKAAIPAGWPGGHHTGGNAAVAHAITTWERAKGPWPAGG